jgi:hypothetical protein
MYDTRDKGETPLWKLFGAGALIVVLLITLVVVVWKGDLNRVQSNEWGCQYGGGLEKRELKQTIAPGQSGGFSFADKLVTVPSDDRLYAIDSDPSTADFGGALIVVPAKGTDAENNGIVPVVVPIQARFTINENACALYNNYLKGKAGPIDWNGTNTKTVDGREVPDPGVWPKFLNLQMNQVLNTAARAQLGGKSYVELYTNFSNYPTIQRAIAQTLTDSLNQSLGGEFFCGPSYQFDGTADGVVESCPPIEIVIKEIKPEDPVFLANLKKIVANQEEQTVIQSDKEKAIAQAQATSEQQIAQANADRDASLNQTEVERDKSIAATEANRETQLAQVEADREIQLAKALADVEIAQAFSEVVALETANELVKKQVETAFCERLADVGVNCADYFKAQKWTPSIILGEGATPLVNIG